MASISWGTCRGRSIALRVQAVRTVKRTKWSIPIFKCHVNFLFLPLYCVLKIEAFVVALIWSPGRNCATDWILKYTPLRVLQTMDTNRKRLKLEQQCLTRDYQCDVWCVQRRNFCRSWGATLQLNTFLERHRLWARNLWSILKGENQANFIAVWCACCINTWRNTEEWVGSWFVSMKHW